MVFLDVEMPVISGVDCAKKTADIDPRAIIIFATAHEKYIHDAFEVYAFDYLVKLKGTEKDALLTHDKLEELQRFFK